MFIQTDLMQTFNALLLGSTLAFPMGSLPPVPTLPDLATTHAAPIVLAETMPVQDMTPVLMMAVRDLEPASGHQVATLKPLSSQPWAQAVIMGSSSRTLSPSLPSQEKSVEPKSLDSKPLDPKRLEPLLPISDAFKSQKLALATKMGTKDLASLSKSQAKEEIVTDKIALTVPPPASDALKSSAENASEPSIMQKPAPQAHIQKERFQEDQTPKAQPQIALKPDPPALQTLAVPKSPTNKVHVSAGISQSPNRLDLTLGKAIVLPLNSAAKRISISNPDVVQAVIISPSVIQLIGKQVGSTNLMVWEKNQTNAKPHVIDLAVMRDVTLLARQLQSIDPGITVSPLAGEDTVVLGGKAQTRMAAETAITLAQAFFNASSGGGGSSSVSGASGSSGGNSGGSKLSSMASGSSSVATIPKVINLIHVDGMPNSKFEQVQQQLANIHSGIQLNIYKNQDGSEKAVLTGKVPTPGLVSKAINLTSVFYGQPGLKVLTGPGGNSVRQSGDSNFPNDTGFSTNMDINILQGSVISDASGNVVSMLEVTQRAQVRCSIKFLDVSQSALKQLGGTLMGTSGSVAYGSFSAAKAPLAGKGIADFVSDDTGSIVRQAAGAISQAGSASQTFRDGVTQFITINNKLTAALSALEEDRKVRSLAEPTLVLLSGEKASFLAGGEVPIPVLGGNGQANVEYKEFGIRLNIIATVNDNGKIHLQIAPEVSAVDPAITVSTSSVSVPGFRSRRMQTTLELNPGESFVLAGLYNSEDAETVSRFPGLGSVPILGSFFRSRSRDSRDNELVVIIQPEVMLSANERATNF